MSRAAEPADPAERRRREASTRTLLGAAGVTTVAGVALAATGDASISRFLTLGGLALLVVGLHRFGRLGADPPREDGADARG